MSSEKWVIFDLIGVLAEPSWRDIANKPEHATWSKLKRGEIPEASFWSNEERDLYKALLSFRNDRIELVHRLKGKGIKVCVATNFFSEWLEALLATLDGGDIFDAKVISAEIKAAKPERRFYEVLLEKAPKGSIFIDDQERNCDAAREAGFRSIWAHPACPLEEELRRMLDVDITAPREAVVH